jgi:ankyrin repeat protein
MLSIFDMSCVKYKRKEIIMNETYSTKNKFLKTIALGSFLFGGFAGTFSQLQACSRLRRYPAISSFDTETLRQLHIFLDAQTTPSERLIDAIYAHDVAQATQLLNANVDPNTRDAGRTLLHLVVLCATDTTINNMLDLIDLLCNAGADINAQDDLGYTPLNRAIAIYSPFRYRPINLKLVEKLLQRGANINIPNAEGSTPSSVVAQALQKDPQISNIPLAMKNKRLQEYTEVQKLFIAYAGQNAIK